MEHYYNSLSKGNRNSSGNISDNQSHFPNAIPKQSSSQSMSVSSGNNMIMNMNNLVGMRTQQQPMALINNLSLSRDSNFGGQQIKQHDLSRLSENSEYGPNSSSITNPFSNKSLLEMLDKDIESNQHQKYRDNNHPTSILNMNPNASQQNSNLMMEIQQRIQQQGSLTQQNNLKQLDSQQQDINYFLQRHCHNLTREQSTSAHDLKSGINNLVGASSHRTSMNTCSATGSQKLTTSNPRMNMGNVQALVGSKSTNPLDISNHAGTQQMLPLNDMMMFQSERLHSLQSMINRRSSQELQIGDSGAVSNVTCQQMSHPALNLHSQNINMFPQNKAASAMMEERIPQGQMSIEMGMNHHGIGVSTVLQPQNFSALNNAFKCSNPLSTKLSPSPPLSLSALNSSVLSVGSVQATGHTTPTNTKVVPVSLSLSLVMQRGDVSEAALIYAKYALHSIVLSLNALKRFEHGAEGDLLQPEKVYTIRDLSTCLGAWDLNVSSRPSSTKCQKMERNLSEFGDDCGDTAFNFYHDRTCPIFLNMEGRQYEEVSSPENKFQTLTGAIVLTFGTDRKFTGGIGEEGIMTKAIFEFFHDPCITIGKISSEECDLKALYDAEEQVFAMVDGELSPFIQAALYSLSPVITDVNGAICRKRDYVPVIWSGNTKRMYRYFFIGNVDDNGNELASRRLCVAITTKSQEECTVENWPSKGVCRIAITLSPASVLAEKKEMAKEPEGEHYSQSTSVIHRILRQNLRTLRPPKIISLSQFDDSNAVRPSTKRRNLRRPSIPHLIDPESIIFGKICKHELLLDRDEVGKVHINGALVIDCSLSHDDTRNDISKGAVTLGTLGSGGLPAHTLFGIDFTYPEYNIVKSVLPDRSILEKDYSALLRDVLIDASQSTSDFAGKLLHRLISGKVEEGLDEDDQDDEDKGHLKDELNSMSKESIYCSSDPFCVDDLNRCPSPEIAFDNVSQPCLESIILLSSYFDYVGIGAKALATKFLAKYGKDSYPCEMDTDEGYQLEKIIGVHMKAKYVPRRARDILSRGGYLPLVKMISRTLERERSIKEKDIFDSFYFTNVIKMVVVLLRRAGFNDITSNMIRFFSREEPEIPSISLFPLVSFYDSNLGLFYISKTLCHLSEKDEDCEHSVVKKDSAANLKDSMKLNKEDDGGHHRCAVFDGGPFIKQEIFGDNSDFKEPNNKARVESNIGQTINGDGKYRIEQGDKITMMGTMREENIEERLEKTCDTTRQDTEVKDKKEDESENELSFAQSEMTDEDVKKKYRPFNQAAFIIGLFIAKEHPDAMVLKKFVTYLSS